MRPLKTGLLLMMLLGLNVKDLQAQILVSDQAYLKTITENEAIYQSLLASRKTHSAKALALTREIAGNITVIEAAEKTIYMAYSELSTNLKELSLISWILYSMEKTTSDQGKLLQLSVNSPTLLAASISMQNEYMEDLLGWITEVNGTVLKSGSSNLMNTAQRLKMLQEILREVNRIRQETSSMLREMRWMDSTGILSSENNQALQLINNDKVILSKLK